MSDHTDIATLLQATRFAAEKHRYQRRKGADAPPYINHPIEVADLLREHGGRCRPMHSCRRRAP